MITRILIILIISSLSISVGCNKPKSAIISDFKLKEINDSIQFDFNKQFARNRICNEKAFKNQFEMYMNQNFPDWPVYDLSVNEVSDCVYQMSFYSINPHFTSFGEYKKEYIVYRMEPDSTFLKVRYKRMRGTIY